VRLKASIEPGTTLIFFDEVQACERALTSLKYFYEQSPQYHVIAAGSLLGIALSRKQQSYPVGKVDHVQLYPLDFEEYLWAEGEEELAELIRESYHTNKPLGLHEYAMGYYKNYLIVGGMPEVVRTTVSKDSEINMFSTDTRTLQQAISNAYVADMTKYAGPLDGAKILNVWRGVPEQLAKENHKFQYATIASSARAYQYEAPVNWLKAAGLVMFCYRVNEGVAPLKAFMQQDFFKLYLLDVGILSCQYAAEPQDLEPNASKTARFRGGIVENYVMQQLTASGIDAFYWGTASKSEVEFVYRDSTGRVIPIEVKSGKNVTARSLEAYRKAYDPAFAIRISSKNFGFERGIKSVPLYAVFCIE
jgi:predicted AAA+ superfamily ATPase